MHLGVGHSIRWQQSCNLIWPQRFLYLEKINFCIWRKKINMISVSFVFCATAILSGLRENLNNKANCADCVRPDYNWRAPNCSFTDCPVLKNEILLRFEIIFFDHNLVTKSHVNEMVIKKHVFSETLSNHCGQNM